MSAPLRVFVPLIPVAESLEWQLRGACRGLIDDDTFFPARSSGAARGKRICRDCPVKTQCLADALDHGEPWGTRGGLSEWERAKLLDVKRR